MVLPFTGLREHWPEPLLQRHHWHECSLNAMVCTRDLPENVRKKWHSFQVLVCQLLTQWMTLNRDKDQYEPFLPRSVDTPARCFGPASLRNNLSQKTFGNVQMAKTWHITCHAKVGWNSGRFQSPFLLLGACGLLLMYLAAIQSPAGRKLSHSSSLLVAMLPRSLPVATM